MRTIVRNIQVLAIIFVTGMALQPWPAQARPGTPKDLQVFDCSEHIPQGVNDYYNPNRKLYDDPPHPTLCVTLINTATEGVVFEIELKSWAQLLSHQSVGSHCMWEDNYFCTAGYNFQGDFSVHAERSKDNPLWDHEGFKLIGLDFHRQYCIRVRTREVPSALEQKLHINDELSQQPVSLQWTNWTCQVTSAEPVAPPMPPKPTPPHVAVETSKHGDKVFVTWKDALNVGYYSIEGKTSCKGVDMSLVPRDSSQLYEADFTLDVSWANAMDMADNAYNYRVCNHNDSGVACSEWARNTPDIPQCLRQLAQLHAVLESPNEASNVVVRVPDPSVTVPKRAATEILTREERLELARQAGRLHTSNHQPEPPYVQWITGTFDSDFGALTLTPEGGSYTHHDGRISVSSHLGPNMEGSWQESTGTHQCADGLYRGRFRFVFTETGFTGHFGYCDGPTDAGNWNGIRHEEVIH